MHFPKDLEEYKQALRRIKFEELFYFQLNLQVLKANNKSESNGLLITYDHDQVAAKIAALPFALTNAQKRSLDEILADMKSGAHMNRLYREMSVLVRQSLPVLLCMQPIVQVCSLL